MNILVVIPAKAESSRLPNKNMCKIGDRTLLEISVDYAKSSTMVSDLVISTDSEQIKHFVESKSLCECIMRDKSLSGETDVMSVYRHAWEQKSRKADYVVGLQPDNPDRTLLLDDTISYVLSQKLDDFCTVDKTGKKNGSIRIFRIGSSDRLGTLQDDCTNIHTKADLDVATSRMLIDANPLDLPGGHVFIIAEAACNHMCSIELAKAMIDCAHAAGVDAIKFQTYKGERIVTRHAGAFWGDETMKQTEYYKRLDRFDRDDYLSLFNYAESLGVLPFSTPFSIEDANILNEIGMKIFKVPSFEIVNIDLIRHVASFGKPIILSTGAASGEEIDKAVNAVISEGNYRLALMACTLSYPTENKDANLLRIQTLKNRYPNFVIGMSDHTEPDENMAIPAISVALGARIIEKHYTMSRRMTGSGHFFSLEPDDLVRMVKNIRLCEQVLGNGELGTAACENRAKFGGRKSIVTARDVAGGEILTKDMLVFKRPGTGLCPSKIDEVAGKRTRLAMMADHLIHLDELL